jgi:ATP-dependent helicase/nuclease subunit A
MGERNAPPAFLSGKTEEEAAFAGTATHVFLQFADFGRLASEGAEAERDRLLEKGFLTAEMAAAVRIPELVRFAGSELFARMRRAQWIRREFRFNAALPAADFTEDPALADALRADGTDVTVQGVIDALFIDEDGRAVLVDYKTDRLTAEEAADPVLAAQKLVPRHENQLRWYRTVTAAMLGREIDECLIYSLPLGGTVEVP